VLLRFAQDEQPAEDNAVVLRGLTQRELASLVGTTRESINKWMLFFERQGWIEFRRGQIKILQPDLLMDRIQEI
jgi:CRP-like cAMP-binding protein